MKRTAKIILIGVCLGLILQVISFSSYEYHRIENGTRNPSLEMVKRIATGLGMQLKLEFIPAPTKH